MAVTGASSVEPRVGAYERYSEAVDTAHATMVWTHPGLRTYYRNSRGRVVVNMPWRGVDYWKMIRHPDFEHLVVDATPEPAAP
jgi:4-hydroxyacetophenone monooxygenase